MRRGHLHSVVWVVLVALLTLLVLSWLPDIKIGGWQMRRIDLLSDVRGDSLLSDGATEMLETLSVAEVQSRIRIDTCRAGMTCIDDMADDEERGMTPL